MALYWKVCVIVTLAVIALVSAQPTKLVGGWTDVDENDETVQRVLQFAKDEYNKHNKEKNECITKINKVYRVKKQVVSGMKYYMEVRVSVGSCLDSAQGFPKKTKKCTFTVLTVPWLNKTEMLKGYCS